MRCARCHRVLTAAAVTIASNSGPHRYGPKCAAMMGIADGKGRVPSIRVISTRAVSDNPGQLQLEGFS